MGTFLLIAALWVETPNGMDYQVHELDSGLTYDDCVYALDNGTYNPDSLGSHGPMTVTCESNQ